MSSKEIGSNPLQALRNGRLPKMVGWYNPVLLARVGVRTIISYVFGQYADQRLMQAASDTSSDVDLCNRYDYRDVNASDAHKRIAVDDRGAFWIDYVADVGDGFESTYTIAYLLAQHGLDIPAAGRLRHGEILIMGGDQCYPQATREEYKRRLLQPYDLAFNVTNPDRKLFAIPGNHDWYDGLGAFDSLFCSARDRLTKGNVIGGCQCQQHRSYWAIRLPYNWWIWGSDIQMAQYLDASQVGYFEAVAEQMGPQDNLIICLAEPSWMLADLQGQDEEQNFFKITTIARRKGARIRAVIAGDWHHYNRYYAQELDVHFITAGGGGAFMHPTHVLKNALSVRWPERPTEGQQSSFDAIGMHSGENWQAKDYDIRLKRRGPSEGIGAAFENVRDAIEPAQVGRREREPLKPQATKCYPSKGRSHILSLGNLLFPFYNPSFAVGIGMIYWLITWEFQTLVDPHGISSGKIDDIGVGSAFWNVLAYMPLYLVEAMLVSISLVLMLGGLYATLVWYVEAVERPGLRRKATKFVVGTTHFVAHLVAMFTLSLFVVMLNNLMAPTIEKGFDAVWQAREVQPPVIRDVIREALEPLRPGDHPGSGKTEKGRPTAVRDLVGFVSYPTLMITLGALIGGSLWGFYWVTTGLLMRMHAEEAFSALRIANYKNFLRLKFEPDTLTIYPLGIDKVPAADGWTNASREKATAPASNSKLVPLKPIDVRLIENPIVISRLDRR